MASNKPSDPPPSDAQPEVAAPPRNGTSSTQRGKPARNLMLLAAARVNKRYEDEGKEPPLKIPAGFLS